MMYDGYYQPILPKQTAAEMAEMTRQDVEDDVAFFSERRDSQLVGGGTVNPVNWLGGGHQMMGSPTGGMFQHDQHGQQFHHDQQIQYGQYGQHEHQTQYIPQVQQYDQQYDQQTIGNSTTNLMQHPDMLQHPGMMMQQPDMGSFDSSQWGGFANQHFGSQSFEREMPFYTGSGSQHNLDQAVSPTTIEQHQALPTMENIRSRQSLPLASHEGNFRYPAPQVNTLQQIQATAAAFGQPGHAHSVSEGSHVQHDSISPQQNKVAITTLPQSRASHQAAALAPNPSSNANVTMGPTSGAVIIPPRPKPGRKPLPQEHAQDRRRVQNRQAQRNFRDKRAQKVSELTADNERVRKFADEQYKQFTNRLNDQKQRNVNLMQENERLKKELKDAIRRAEDAERQVHALDVTNRFNNAGFPNGGLQKVGSSTAMPPMPSSLTGPVDAHLHASGVPIVMAATVAPHVERANNTGANEVFEHEIDMSHLWNRMSGKPTKAKPVPNDKYAPDWLGSNMDVDQEGSCGFCTDESNCACIQSQKPQPVIAPGGCDACVRDPQRAAACKAFAERAEVSQRPAQNAIQNGNLGQRNDSMAPPSGMVSCSNLIDQVGLQRMPSIAELFPGKFHAYPVTSGSGYDVNEQEAAQVLQSMSRRNTIAGAAGAHL